MVDRKLVTVRSERRLRRILCSQRSHTLAQITTQLNDGTNRNARFTAWVSGAVDLPEYHCSMLAIGLNVLPGQESTETGVQKTEKEKHGKEGKGHHTVPTNPTELWTALANICEVIPVERFQKLVESMPRRVVTVIKTRGGPTRY
ncbi:hypothetical protein TNCV_3776431 [Trichonephila clavipes]|nr:hypothetical protein TNCV_3776431 [Trichonephila clavipes]